MFKKMMPNELVLKEKNTENEPSGSNENESRWGSVMRKRLDEGVFILIAAISLFLLLSLTSYDKADPGWFSPAGLLAVGNKAILNAGGWVGAYIADIFLCFLGVLAYCLPLVATYLAWIRLGQKHHVNEEEIEEFVSDRHGVRFLGAFLLILGASGLASFEFPISLSILPYTTGGVIGDSFSQGLSAAFNPKGTVLLLLAMCFMGITLLTGLSWVSTSEKVGAYSVDYLNKLSLFVGKSCEVLYRHMQLYIRILVRKIHIKIQQRKENKENKAGNVEKNLRSVEGPIITTDAPVSASSSAKVSSGPSMSTVNVSMDSFSQEKSPRIDEKTFSELHASMSERKDRGDHVRIMGNNNYSEVSVDETNAELESEKEYEQQEQQALDKKYTSYTRQTNTESSTSASPVVSHTSLLKKVDANSIPPLSLLEASEKSVGKGYTGVQLESMAREVEQRLLDFGIEAQVVAVNPGPVITRFELQLAAGIKVSRITGLAKDLARSLSVISVRVVEVIPGKPVIGLELPNQYREMVRLKEIFLTDQFQQARSPVSMALGVDISGYPVVVDLAKMPHLLVAGTTGSGKSVGLNAMLLSILFKATPDEVRLILVDPKMLEFSIYDRIPHLLTPVVTDMKEAAGALRWCVAEMERRYRLMSALGLRNLAAYNALIKEAAEKGEFIKDPLWRTTQNMEEVSPYLAPLPYIVVVIDELADMMMIVGKKVEQLIARIAQKARAAGIHLILATQRPSVDVLTGLIKSNIPTRIAFQVSSKIDSRTILDQQGADQLLGHGDMLYLTPGSGAPVRIHGAFVDDKEVHRVADAWRERGDPQYVDIILKSSGDGEGGFSGEDGNGEPEEADPLYDEAVRFVTETRKASISSVQRRLKVGYNRAARLIEEMERTGVVSSMESNGVRDVLAPPPPED